MKFLHLLKKLGLPGRAPHGARGLKCVVEVGVGLDGRRAPHGARGLKYLVKDLLAQGEQVAPRTGRVD